MNFPRRWILVGLIAAAASAATPMAAESAQGSDAYQSPYAVNFSYPLGELIGDIQRGERGQPHQESSVPFAEWYSLRVRRQFGGWGPPARHFPAAPLVGGHPIEWQRQRVIAVALQFQGYGYQHHHVPDWNPPSDWPWKETKLGHNGKGVDCSNFTSFAYNLALGINLSGDVKEQSAASQVSGLGANRIIQAARIELPRTYADRVRLLRTGDLLFIRNIHREISHVALWVGPIGMAPEPMPLILDSHGADVRDCRGNTIPSGVYLRPFSEKSWYSRSASHAIRVLP
jgi:cell wall-associated NlpC family hydrolase